MGFKQNIKQMIIKRAVAKRKRNSTFDDVASEHFELAADADSSQNNSYYFSAHSEDGVSLLCRLAKRGGGLHEVWFAYLDAKGNAFVNKQTEFSAENCPLKLNLISPLKEWHIEYTGQLWRATPSCQRILEIVGEPLKASFDGRFKCDGALYEFSRDTDKLPFARAVSEEKWNKQFFAALSQNTQVHAEQAGHLEGELRVDDKVYTINSPAMRDHSFGKREWGYMDRHIWLMSVSNDTHFNVNMVRYPALKGLRTGYRQQDGKFKNVIDATPLNQMPSNMPTQFQYYALLCDGSKGHASCTIEAAFPFVMGDGAYTIYEGIASFDIDGKRSRGIAEFGFNSDKARWQD